MRKQAAGVCLGLLGPLLWLPRRGDIPLELGQWLGVARRLLASEIQKGGQSYLCQKEENSNAWIFKQMLWRRVLGPT